MVLHFFSFYKNNIYLNVANTYLVYTLNFRKYTFKSRESKLENNNYIFNLKISKKIEFKKVSSSFLKLNFFSFTKVRTIHPVFRSYYLSVSGEDLRVLNLTKFNEIYLNAVYLLYNIFYFNIKFCFFVSPPLKQEAEILNWNLNFSLRNNWRRVVSPIFAAKNASSPTVNLALNFIQSSNIHINIFSDSMHHVHTLYHSRKLNFYTISLNPTFVFIPNIDFIIPTSSPNSYNQIFFFKTVVYIKKLALKDNFLLKKFIINNFYYKLLI